MLSFQNILDIIRDVECEPYAFRFDCILCVRAGASATNPVEYNHAAHENIDHVFFLQAKLWRKDTNTGAESWGFGTKYFISPHMSTSEITRVCIKACLAYAEHEVREAFMYKRKRIYGPHMAASSLLTAADDMELRDSDESAFTPGQGWLTGGGW